MNDQGLLNTSETQAVCKKMAKAIKEIDAGLWVIFGGNNSTANTLRAARLPLIEYILDNGYQLQERTYRLIKAK